MHNKRNVIVMFLLIMLSFAIMTEVSAAGDAEINGTGPNPPIASVDMDAGERYDEDMHNHADDFQSRNDQISFEKTPMDGVNKSNVNLYERSMDFEIDENHHDFNQTGDLNVFKPDGDKMPLKKSMENSSKVMFKYRSMDDLRSSNFTNLRIGEEVMNDVVSKLIGLNNVAPNVKKDEGNISCENPMDGGHDLLAPIISGDVNPSDNLSGGICKKTKTPKIDEKPVKIIKSPKKVKSKWANKRLPKKSRMERAKP